MKKQTDIQQPSPEHGYSDQIAVLRRDIKRLQGDFGKLRQEFFEDAGGRVQEFSEQTGQKLKEKGEQLRHAGERGQRAIKAEVQRRPVTTILAATGAGVALGALAKWAQNGTKQQNDAEQ